MNLDIQVFVEKAYFYWFYLSMLVKIWLKDFDFKAEFN